MSLSQKYFKYLEHFGNTVSVASFHASPDRSDLVALRHDVDHDLDIALEMGCWEHRLGFQSTYYILPDAKYWEDPDLIEKCLQLQDFGHEVGLHLNVLTDWIEGKTDDPRKRLVELLDFFRSSGVNISGTSAHGDRRCYADQFINYWIFSDLRPDNPVEVESCFNAEGIPAIWDEFTIRYPQSHSIVRSDGRELPLWSVSMWEQELDYHAVHVSYDHYYSDSGGEWTRTSDPMDSSLRKGRHQVLIHPEHWRGQQKICFFLSTARSGSKWLSKVLDKASSVHSRHEFMLNHRLIDGKIVEEKRTADGFTELQTEPKLAEEMLRDLRPWVEDLDNDYAEVNVYLEEFLAELKRVYPDAQFIHLHRQLSSVVSSIINRDWYDTPLDDRHPIFDIAGWEGMSQFQQACLYSREVNKRLLDKCQLRLRFEKMVANTEELERVLAEANIAFYPRLATPFFKEKINAGVRKDYPEYPNWPKKHKKLFHEICDSVNKELRYPLQHLLLSILQWAASKVRSEDVGIGSIGENARSPRATIAVPLSVNLLNGTAFSCLCEESANGGVSLVPQVGRNAHYLLGGGRWHEAEASAGWKAELGHYYSGELQAVIPAEGSARMICLKYDADGKNIGQRSLVRIRQDKTLYRFSFRPGSDAARFNLAVYMSASALPEQIQLQSISLAKLPFGHEE